jgi:hypothetical protein
MSGHADPKSWLVHQQLTQLNARAREHLLSESIRGGTPCTG